MNDLIHDDEWLDQAKQVPLNGRNRILHGFESRPNMVVFNNPDSWSCWCFACNSGSRVRKDSPVLCEAPVDTSKPVPLPDDCVALQELSEDVLNKVYYYFLTRGINPDTMLKDMQVLFSAKTMRVCLEMFGGCFSGRGIAGQKVKALTYSDSIATKYAVHPCDGGPWSGTVVITEDYLSALKIRYAMQGSVTAVSAQGCGMPKQLLPKLLKTQVLIMLDGDSAGQKGSALMYKKLKGLINTKIINTPTGKDPKNLTVNEIRSLLT